MEIGEKDGVVLVVGVLGGRDGAMGPGMRVAMGAGGASHGGGFGY